MIYIVRTQGTDQKLAGMVCQLQYNRFGGIEVTFRPRASQLEREREMILRGSFALDYSDLGESEAGDPDVY